MQELIKIEEKAGQQLVDARNLHEFLEIKKDFSDWIKYQTESLDLIDGEDFTPILGRSEAGRQTIEYALTLDSAKHISLASRCEKGKQARKYFIEIEKRYKNNLPQLSVLDTLKIAVKELEQKEIIIQEKTKQIEVMKPNHNFVNQVFKKAETAIKVEQLAQVLKIPHESDPKKVMGRNLLFRKLREKGILKSDNFPVQEYLNRGYFEVKEQLKEDLGKVFFTTYVLPAGQVFISKKLMGA